MEIIKTLSFSDRLTAINTLDSSPSFRSPRDPVFLNREIQGTEELYSYLGHALGSCTLFQDDSITLYCGVPVKYLLPENAPPWDEYLDFVICQGQDIITAVKAARAEPYQPSQEQLYQAFHASALPSELNWSILDASFLNDPACMVLPMESLISRARQASGPHVKTTLRPIPSKLLQKLNSPRIQALTVKVTGGRKAWFPTEYGRSLGILQGFRTDKNNRVRSLLCCAEENLDALQQAVSWGEQTVPPLARETPKKSSFSQRVRLVSQGLPDNAAASAALEAMARDFAETPLSEYLQDNPEGLSELQRNFPQVYTFQQAASCISQNDNGLFLNILADPIIRGADIPLADMPIRNVLWAVSILAKSKYLTWAGEMLLHDCDSSGKARNHSYRQWLQWMFSEFAKGGENTEFFHTLITRFLIEPFSLINLQSNCS